MLSNWMMGVWMMCVLSTSRSLIALYRLLPPLPFPKTPLRGSPLGRVGGHLEKVATHHWGGGSTNMVAEETELGGATYGGTFLHPCKTNLHLVPAWGSRGMCVSAPAWS